MTDISFRKLQVHQVAKQALQLVLHNRAQWRGLPGELGPQLERAMVSAVLNIAEGAGRWTGPDQRRHYQIACGSATEAAACVEIAMLYGVSAELCEQIDGLLGRVVRMLSALIRRR